MSTTEPIAKRASGKLKDTEAIMPVLGGPRLRMSMDKYDLWTGETHVAFAKLADFFARYVYLPWVVSRDVIGKAIENGVAQLVLKDRDRLRRGHQPLRRAHEGRPERRGVDNTKLVVHPDAAGAGADVEIPLEVRVRVPGGVKDDVVRTVTENCNTLKFTSHEFE